jgi:hypothetical protein
MRGAADAAFGDGPGHDYHDEDEGERGCPNCGYLDCVLVRGRRIIGRREEVGSSALRWDNGACGVVRCDCGLCLLGDRFSPMIYPRTVDLGSRLELDETNSATLCIWRVYRYRNKVLCGRICHTVSPSSHRVNPKDQRMTPPAWPESGA